MEREKKRERGRWQGEGALFHLEHPRAHPPPLPTLSQHLQHPPLFCSPLPPYQISLPSSPTPGCGKASEVGRHPVSHGGPGPYGSEGWRPG